MTTNYFSPTRDGRPRIVNRQRSPYGEFRADIMVGSNIIGNVERAGSESGGGMGASQYQAFVHGRRITYGRTLRSILDDLYAAQDARELG